MAEEVLVEQATDGAATKAGTTLVPATDHTLAAENHSRDKLIVSADVADVWLSYGTGAAVVNQGVRVAAGSAPFAESGWKGEVHCISAGAAKVGVIETSYQTGDDEGERPAGADAFVPSGPSDDYFERAVPTAPPPGTPYPSQS